MARRVEERFGRTLTLELICECEGVGCHDGLEIESAAYADARSNPLRFFVVPGHQDPQIEQVVLRTPGYLVVEKVGEAAREILDQNSGGQAER